MAHRPLALWLRHALSAALAASLAGCTVGPDYVRPETPAPVAWSAPLDDAKSAGLIGERPDGYVASVQPNPPPDVARLVQEVNAKRRAAYEDIAAKQGVPVEQVGALTAEKIRAQASPGAYFMTSGGGWTQK